MPVSVGCVAYEVTGLGVQRMLVLGPEMGQHATEKDRLLQAKGYRRDIYACAALPSPSHLSHHLILEDEAASIAQQSPQRSVVIERR